MIAPHSLKADSSVGSAPLGALLTPFPARMATVKVLRSVERVCLGPNPVRQGSWLCLLRAEHAASAPGGVLT